MKNRTKLILGSLVLVALLTGLDQWTKWAVRTQMKPGQSIEVIKHLFYITYVQNTGAGFSIFEGWGKGFFFLVTVAAMALMVWFFIHSKDRGVQLSVTLIFAGALGNFIDRMSLGYVVDFFHVYIFGWSFPVFNIADICITLGFLFLVVHMFLEDRKAKQHA